jgi:DNA-binding GntR family transcriptional regulator
MKKSESPREDDSSFGTATMTFLTKKDVVAGRLREMILSGELAPGTKITQQLMIDRLSVSSTPVREAIRQLESEGYLECPPHLGAFVRTGSPEDLDEVYFLRSIVEARLAGYAARRRTDAELRRIKETASAYVSACRRDDAVAARRSNYQLHRTIWETADQPIALGIAQGLYAKLPWDRFSYDSMKLHRSVPEHSAIIRAFEQRDAAGARRAMAKHVVEQWKRQGGRVENASARRQKKA